MQKRRLFALMMAAVVMLSSVGLTPMTLKAAEAEVIEEELVFESGSNNVITEDGAYDATAEDEVNDVILEDASFDEDATYVDNLGDDLAPGTAVIRGDGMVDANIGTDMPSSAIFVYELYRKGSSEDTLIKSDEEYTVVRDGKISNCSFNVGFWLKEAEKGTYYVNCQFYDSTHKELLTEIKTQDYEYNAPTAQLKTPEPISRYLTNLIQWPINDPTEEYNVEEYKDGQFMCNGGCAAGTNIYNIRNAENMGPGVYEYRVYAISSNVFETKNSDYASYIRNYPDDDIEPAPSDNPTDTPTDQPTDNPEDDNTINVERFDLSVSDMHDVLPGDQFTITAYVGPENATNKNVKWKVIDNGTNDLTDGLLISTGDGASANTLDYGTTVRCYAVRPGSYKVVAYLEADPEWHMDCWCDIRESDIQYEEGEPYTVGGFKIFNVHDEYYGGKPIRFDYIQVYDERGSRLEEGKDFTVSYANNVNAGNKTANVIITPTGDYAGNPIKVPFSIYPISLEWYNEENGQMEPAFPTSANLVVVYNNKEQKPVPRITMWTDKGQVTLKGSKDPGKGDFTYSYPSANRDGAIAYKDVGDWEIKVTGNGNYTGEVTLYENIMSPEWGKPLSKCKITPEKKSYTFAELRENPFIKVKVMDGNTQLKESQYRVDGIGGIAIGKNIINVWALEPGPDDQTVYCGCKEVTINVKATKLTPAMVDFGDLKDQYTYNGRYVEINGIKVNGKDEGFSYTIKKGLNVGTGTVTVTGDPNFGYTGSVTKKFKIVPGDVSEFTYNVNSETAEEDQSVAYSKGSDVAISARLGKSGATPNIWNVYKEEYGDLVLGTDYTVKYENNKKAGQKGTIVITGKGNFKGSNFRIPFDVMTGDIGRLSVWAPDKVYNAKNKNAWKSVPVVTDRTGKKLTAGKDYEKKYIYEFEGKTSEDSIPGIGTVVRVSVKGAGNFKGPDANNPQWNGYCYKIIDASKDISKADFKIQDKAFVGRNVNIGLDEKDFVKAVASDKTTQLKYDVDYIITGYKNNDRKGTASVTLKGIGSYGGTKTVTFNITPKALK